MPSIRRLLAGVGAVALAAVLIALLNGPWLRVGEVGWHGAEYAAAADLDAALSSARGESVLAVDTGLLRDRIEQLPSVASASVSVSLTGRVEASVVEREAAFVWETRMARFIGAADGTLVAMHERTDAVPGELPAIRDTRYSARVLTVGDVVPESLVRVALRLAALDPALLGSSARSLAISVDDDYGFRLISADREWEIAFGVFGSDPHETVTEAEARLDRQVTAVRTLFATRPESELAWVDVRNPGKVYFRAKG